MKRTPGRQIPGYPRADCASQSAFLLGELKKSLRAITRVARFDTQYARNGFVKHLRPQGKPTEPSAFCH